MLYNINILNNEEKNLVRQIVYMFVNGKNYKEISISLNQDIEYIKYILSSKSILRKLYSDTFVEEVQTKNKIALAILKEQEEKQQYENLLDQLVFFVSESLYNYSEIGEILYIERATIRKMLLDKEYIIKKYGQKKYDKMIIMIEKRKKFPKNIKYNQVILKDPKLRSITKPEIITITNYQLGLLQKVVLFFENNGDISNMVKNTNYLLNEVNASLNDTSLKDLLLDDCYKKLQTLLRIDEILTQNKIIERNMFLQHVITVIINENGNIDKIEEQLGYPREIIERIINDSFVPIFCKKNKIDLDSIKLLIKTEEDVKVKNLH